MTPKRTMKVQEVIEVTELFKVTDKEWDAINNEIKHAQIDAKTTEELFSLAKVPTGNGAVRAFVFGRMIQRNQEYGLLPVSMHLKKGG